MSSEKKPTLINPEPNGGYWTSKVKRSYKFTLTTIFLGSIAAVLVLDKYNELNLMLSALLLCAVGLALDKLATNYRILKKTKAE